MATAYLDVLVAECPAASITGVYVKGSAYRPWDTVIDYVPELSDVDIHVRLAPGASAVIRSLPFALNVAGTALATFGQRFPDATHIPRPQLFFLDDLEKLTGYVPSPTGSVRTLLGQDYRSGDRAEYADCAVSDARRFISDARFILEELPGKVIDRPGDLLWRAVARITWRVAPAGPRLLTQMGMDPYDAWLLNRSSVVRELTQRGHATLASSYAEFYLAGWEGFGSGFKDDDAARRALLAASRLYTRGLPVVEGGSPP